LLQLYVIHGLVLNTNETLPIVYILTMDRSERTYKEAFGVLKDICKEENIQLNPNRVMADFETASTNALKYHFPNIEIKGCWFHFRQAINRRSVRIGLKQHLHRDNYRKFQNALGALALIPADRINDGLKIIKTFMPSDSKCKDLYDYFQRQWVKMSPQIWNHYESDIRTNNRVEGFNSGLNRMIKTIHPNIFNLINFLKQQQANTLIDYARLKQGQILTVQSKQEQDKAIILQSLKNQFNDSGNLTDFLTGLVQFVRFPYEYWHCNYIPENDSIYFDGNDSLDTSFPIAADEELSEHAFDDFLRQFNVNENVNNEIEQQEFQIPLEIQILENSEESSNYVQPSTSTYNPQIPLDIQLLENSEESSNYVQPSTSTYNRR
ncbi:unnamed protein product, partial [Brachionus calyciflorus]